MTEYCDFKIEGEWGSIHEKCSVKKKRDGECCGVCLKSEIDNGHVTVNDKTVGPSSENITGYCLRERIKRRIKKKTP